MRLLIVTQYFWPENFRVNDLAAELSRRGHEVTVLTGRPNYPDGAVYPDYAAAPSRFSRYAGCTVVRVPMLARGRSRPRLALNYLSFALAGSALAPYRLRNRRFDAIFVFAPSPITTVVPALVLKWFRRVPVALWALDLWPQSLEAVDAVRSRVLLRAAGRVVHGLYRRCDLLLAQSRGFFREFAQARGAGRVAYLPGWAEALPSPDSADPAPEIPPGGEHFTVLFAGNIGVAQDFPAILAAAEILRDSPVRWLIVGDGNQAEWLGREVVERGLDGVVLLGRHPLERMPSFFRHADALLVSLRPRPTFALTIPGKLQSYLAAGKPILAMLDGEGAEIVRRARAGLAVAAGDAGGLAAAVRELMARSEAERAEMGRRGRHFHARHFDRTMLISRLERRLERLIRDNPR